VPFQLKLKLKLGKPVLATSNKCRHELETVNKQHQPQTGVLFGLFGRIGLWLQTFSDTRPS